jgi:hypothetical protein
LLLLLLQGQQAVSKKHWQLHDLHGSRDAPVARGVVCAAVSDGGSGVQVQHSLPPRCAMRSQHMLQ